MSITTKYLVFEETDKPLNMNKINVFANGAEMPWTYYQADITSGEDEKKRFMWTSESEPSSPGAGDAGTYASEIKRMSKLGLALVEEKIKNPTIEDFKSWEWPLSKDANGVEVLPKYGEFAFRPGFAPSYEDASSIQIDWKFGFGLNGTCYNFVDETVQIDVYNLTCEPEFYLTSNPTCNPVYTNGSWNSDMTPAVDGKIKEYLTEGTDAKGNKDALYLLVKVEAGERIQLQTHADNEGDLDFTTGSHEVGAPVNTAILNGAANYFIDNDTNINLELFEPFKMNVPVSETVTGMAMKFDFYRIKVEANDDKNTLAYLSVPDIKSTLTFTPVVYGNKLSSFKRNIQLDICMKKRVKLPYIRDDLQLKTENEGAVGQPRDLSDMSNLRMRLIVTPEEAINYGIKTGTGPSFLRNKTFDEAVYTYQRSCLTETEKCLDDYKLSFANEDKLKELVYYIAVDLSSHALDNFKTFGQNDQSAVCDLSNVYTGMDAAVFGTSAVEYVYKEPLDKLRTTIKSELEAKNVVVSQTSIMANAITAKHFQDVYDVFNYNRRPTGTDKNYADDKRSYTDRDMSNLPHRDSTINQERLFGEILDVSCAAHNLNKTDYEHMRLRTSLMGANSTLLTLMFALNKYKKTGSDELINKYAEAMKNVDKDYLKNDTDIYRLVEAMRNEYQPQRENGDLSGNSMLRSSVLNDELEDFRFTLNPVNGPSAARYIHEIVSLVDIRHGTETQHKCYYGTYSVYDTAGTKRIEATTDAIKALLYKGGLSKEIKTQIDSNKNLNSYFIRVANPLLGVHGKDAQEDMGINNEYNYYYEQLNTSTATYDDHLALGSSHIRNAGYDNADQSAVFYKATYDYGDDRPHGDVEYNSLVGDASGVYTSFYMNDDATNGSTGPAGTCVEKQWVYTKQYGPEGSVYEAPSSIDDKRAGGYTNATRTKENEDFSGIIKIGGNYGGDYIDAYVFDGTKDVEIRETYLDIHDKAKFTSMYKADDSTRFAGRDSRINIDISALCQYDYLTKDISDSRPELLKKEKTMLKLVNVGGFYFYRIGSVIRVIADKNNLNYETEQEKKQAGQIPKITFKTRGDVEGLCDKSYQLYAWPQDVSSNLRIMVNPFRKFGMGYDVSSTGFQNGVNESDYSGVAVSRWTQSYIPVDISGIIEPGEKFKLSLSKDKYQGTQFIFQRPGDETYNTSGHVNYSAGFKEMTTPKVDFSGTEFEIPDDCGECKFTLQYKFKGGQWADATDVEFEYECHHKEELNGAEADDKYADASNTKYNSGGIIEETTESESDRTYGESKSTGDYTVSSNIKGYPTFRLCLPSQKKILQSYKTENNVGIHSNYSMGENGYDNFGTVLRKVQVNMTYTHSSTLKSTFHQDTMAYVYVNSDAYDANVKVTALEWTYFNDDYNRLTTYSFNNKNNQENTSSSTRTLPAISGGGKYITFGLKDFTDNTRGKQPDESKMVSYDFKPGSLTNIPFDNGVRDISSMELCMVENTFGPDMPIAEVSFDNYIKENGQFGATAEIIPIFKKSTDYNEWRMDRTYSKKTNAATTGADYDDLTSNPEETFLPANTNYGVYLNSEGNKAYLYRKEPVNYEDWNKKYGKPDSRRELVAVSVRYEAPNDVEGRINNSLNFENNKTLVFAVDHTDAPEIKWSDNFTFNVDEGDSSVDITSILSATLHGDPDCIDYKIAGWIDDSGCIYAHTNGILANSYDGTNKIFLDLSENFDLSMIKDFDGRSASNRVGLVSNYDGDTADGSVTDLVLNPTSPKDIVHSDYAGSDLEDSVVNGKLIIYHKNHATKATTSGNPSNTNNKFDAYKKKSHKLLVVAHIEDMNNVDRIYIERKIALVNINVREASTGFKIKANKSSIINTVETLGTVAEGLSEAANNPEFSIQEKIIDAITHEDLTTEQLNDSTKVKYSISYIDPDLAVCPPSSSDGEEVPFSEKVIKLKDTPANKTTETATGSSEKLAYHNHYNYERKSEYQVHVCAEFCNYEEIKVKQVDNYICGEYPVASQQDVFNGANKKAKTADFIMLDETVDGIKQKRPVPGDNSSKFYYFKHPSTGKYVGPLSTTPYAIEDLTATKEVNGVKAKYAYVRYEAKDTTTKQNNDFTPLYKAPGFSDRMAKAPKPTDTCLLIFTIKVLNTFDKARTLPQAYTTTGNKPFKFSDPTEGLLTDSDTVTVEEGAKHIAYVYADHSELNTNGGKDHEDTALIPAWHPHFKDAADVEYNEWTMGGKTYKKNELGAGTVRKSHPRATVETMNKKPEVGITTNGHANNSVRYGRFRDSNVNGGVFLDFFVEHHGEIDCSGHNEHSDEILFGQAVDYSGTVGKFVYSDNHDPMRFGLQREANSDRRLYRLNCMVRHAQHFNTDLSDSFYAKGQIAFNECNRAEFGKIYKFSVAAVSNKLATAHDLSYNKNMVDWNRSFYPYIKESSTDQISGSNNKVDMPQPFQKYVYDPSGERVVTMGYALSNIGGYKSDGHDMVGAGDIDHHGFEYKLGDKSVDSSGLSGAIIRPFHEESTGAMKLSHYYSGSALPNADSSGALFTTRTHFTVVVTKGGCDIVTSDKLSENTGKMVFNSKQIVKNVTVDETTGVVSGVPSDVSAKDGEIRIMQDADGTKHMAYYNSNSKSWTTI